MVSVMVWKNSMLRLSKALPHQPTTTFLYPTRVSLSKICFSSLSSTSSSESRYEGDDRVERGLGGRHKPEDKDLGDMSARDLGDISKETAERVSGKAKEGSEKAGQRMQEMKNDAKKKTWDATERAKQSMHDTKEEAKDAAGEAKEKVKGAAGWTAEKAKEGSESVGEAVKGTVAGAWDAAKGASQKIKETVVGKSEDEKTPEELMEDHLNKRAGDDPNKKKIL